MEANPNKFQFLIYLYFIQLKIWNLNMMKIFPLPRKRLCNVWVHILIVALLRLTIPVRVTHYTDVIMDTIASQITRLTIIYSTVYSDADQRKYQSSASLAFVRGIQRWPVNSPHKWPVTQKMFPFDDVIMLLRLTIPVRVTIKLSDN